jgi:CubicO group peptidase (beta-lactamase class C family)
MFCCFPAIAERPKAQSPLRERIDALLVKQFPSDAPGAAVLVVRDGKLILEKGYGTADLGRKTPVTSESNFDLASMSKPFTALAVMILADRGKLGFDDDVRKYLPELAAPPGPRPVRIRDLLQHTSGIPEYSAGWQRLLVNLSKLTNDRVVQILKDRKPDFLPGAEFKYCNSNYVLLAEIVRRVGGRRFGEFMRDEVFRPLGMDRTVAMDDLSIKISDRAIGYMKAGREWEPATQDSPVCGDGNVFSNLRDLAKWDTAMAAEKLVRPATWRLAWTASKLDDGKETGYGFGWVIEKRVGKRFVWHNGRWGGIRTMIGRWPDDQLTIMLLCNDDGAEAEKLVAQIAEIVFDMTR